MLGRIYLQLE